MQHVRTKKLSDEIMEQIESMLIDGRRSTWILFVPLFRQTIFLYEHAACRFTAPVF